MIYDGKITIATGHAATAKHWKNTELRWSELVDQISTPTVTKEKLSEYESMSKDMQLKTKDVGGFVGGFLKDGKRNPEAVLHRQLLTLDIDFASKNFWDLFTMSYDCAAVLHSTHKHKPSSPRLRLIIPINRRVNGDEYIAIARKVAGNLGIDLFDPTTFQINRLMFWPSHSVDAEYVYEVQDGEWLDADATLGEYADWKNSMEWPVASSSTTKMLSKAGKQEDPEEKKGLIGAFCRTYSIQDAIETFLSDVYEHAAGDRYTYLKGSTAGGLIIYDDKFAYSHHGTDPASSRLCNAFDLVRLHKFSELDEGTGKELASQKAMEQFAANDNGVKVTLGREKLEIAKEEFGMEPIETSEGGEADEEESEDRGWMVKLKANNKGEYDNSAANITLILRNDPILKNAFVFNAFDCKRYVAKRLPWRVIEGMEPVKDVDYAGVRNYIETVYGIASATKVDDALSLEFERKSFHPVRDYLNGLKWDGKKRIDTLLHDYFGCEQNIYTAAAARKTLAAAVARVYNPGIKFELVLSLIGGQGVGKSTFARRLGGDWFSEEFSTLNGKEAYEQLQGKWIIEIAELSALKKAEVETIKQFVSKCSDTFRPAYGRTTETFKRQCVFIATTNEENFLRDHTGNRRFVPIDVKTESATKNIFTDLTPDEVGQIWAEAKVLWSKGEKLYFTEDEEKIARHEQTRHMQVDERAGLVESFLETPIPIDWDSFSLDKRLSYLNDPLLEGARHKETALRQQCCIAEIWCELFGKDKKDMTRYNTRELNEIMKQIPGWEFVNSTKMFRIYGRQKYFRRIS